jgi:hypothetical protein
VDSQLPDIAAVIAEAKQALRVRDEGGRFVAGGPGARMATGTRSEALAPVKAQLVESTYRVLLADVGGESETTVAQRAVAKSLAEAIVLREMVWLHMVETGGPISTKGRRRPVFDMHAQLSDRIGRLSVGFLERRHKPVGGLQAALAAHEGVQDG